MLIRKNTKAFKTILEIFKACQGRPDREKLIRLFITKAGNSVADRIAVEGIQGGSALFYEMNYQTVLNSLQSSNHQLNVSDTIPGIYYFHSSSNKSWDETPFEFDEAVKSEFSKLPDLPLVRKKEKAEKTVIPVVHKTKSDPKSKTAKVETKKPAKAVMFIDRGPKQPDFKLRHSIRFSNLERVIFRQPEINKLDLLNYYNKISESILPHLKDRAGSFLSHRSGAHAEARLTTSSLFADQGEDAPDWLKTADVSFADELIISNDREHLLLAVESGAVQFNAGLSRLKQIDFPDYLVIGIDSPESDITKAIDAALALKTILDGLQLPGFIKTDGTSGFHVYVPLDAKSTFEVAAECAEYLCRLVKIKRPELVAFSKDEDQSYGKVLLDTSMNAAEKTVVVPYSVLANSGAVVATPLAWDELNAELQIADFTMETIFQRLKQEGDLFENLGRKKIDATELLSRMNKFYGFLF